MGAGRRVLITGGAGFVGPHLVAAIRAELETDAIYFTGLAPMAIAGAQFLPLDLSSTAALRDVLAQTRPTDCVHLAGISQPPVAAREPDLAWRVNLLGTVALIQALRDIAPDCRLLHVSSGDIYGAATRSAAVDETTLVAPITVYAATKAAADLAVGQAALEGLRVVRVRPFNHIGPGQTEAFVTAAIAAQIARAEAGLAEPVLRIGATDRERDFLDVRDVVAAYVAVLRSFDSLQPGEIFNIASGRSRSIQAILDYLIQRARRPIEVRQDPALVRRVDVAQICGDASKATRLLGWRPKIAWEEALDAVLEDWRARVAAP